MDSGKNKSTDTPSTDIPNGKQLSSTYQKKDQNHQKDLWQHG